LHLAIAHLSTHGLQYRKHHDVNFALNPDVPVSISKLPQDEYDAYIALQRLSRRSRYLVNDKDIRNERVFLIYDKHLAKAVKYLDKLLAYFSKKYQVELPAIPFTCPELKRTDNLLFFILS